MRSERVQNDLGATAGLRYRNGQPRTSVTERVSGGGEPHPDGDLGLPTVCGHRMSPAVKAEKSETNRAIDAQLQFVDQELRRHTER